MSSELIVAPMRGGGELARPVFPVPVNIFPLFIGGGGGISPMSDIEL